MIRVLVPLAEGFEEIETTTLVDVLRRAELHVTLAGLDGVQPTRGSRGILITPDAAFDDVADHPFDLVVLPGGMGGTQRLAAHPALTQLLAKHVAEHLPVAAICAAPLALEAAGVLDPEVGFTSHPGVAPLIQTPGRRDDITVDTGLVITSQSAGTAMSFALHLVERFCSPETLQDVLSGLNVRIEPRFLANP